MKDILQHWGVLGMHWGASRGNSSSPSSGGSKRGGSETAKSADHIRASQIKKKKLSEMSNDEIRDLATRMQLEKQYKDLTLAQKGSGRKIALDIFMGSAKTAAGTIVQDQMTKFGKDMITKALGKSAEKKAGELAAREAAKLAEEVAARLANL